MQQVMVHRKKFVVRELGLRGMSQKCQQETLTDRSGYGHRVFLYTRPSFMMTLKFLAGSAIRLIFSSGLPSTSSRSASAPCSTTPSFPGYGLRLPDNASSSALVPVAIASDSAALYQRTSEARIAPCCCASAWEHRTSVPHAVLLLHFFASSYVAAIPGQTSSALAR